MILRVLRAKFIQVTLHLYRELTLWHGRRKTRIRSSDGTLGHVKTHHVLLRTTRAEPTRVKQRARWLSTHRPGT